MEAVERLVGRLRRDKAEALAFGRHEWGMQIRKCFPTAEPTGAANWNHGGLDFEASAAGVRMFAVLDDSRRHVAAGGERSWLQRADVGEDGFLSGWKERVRSASSTVFFDETGWPEWPHGVPVQEHELSSLEPTLQLQCRARMILGDEVETMLPCYSDATRTYVIGTARIVRIVLPS